MEKINALAYKVFEEMKNDIGNKKYRIYLDICEYEDEYSWNDVESARDKFIELANEYFHENIIDYVAKEVNEGVYIFNKNTGERLLNFR